MYGCELNHKEKKSCSILCDSDPMDSDQPGSSEARALEWIAFSSPEDLSFSRGSSWLGDQTQISCIAGRRFNLWASREALNYLSSFQICCVIDCYKSCCTLYPHTHLLYNWIKKFVPVDVLQSFCPPPIPTSGNHQSALCIYELGFVVVV